MNQGEMNGPEVICFHLMEHLGLLCESVCHVFGVLDLSYTSCFGPIPSWWFQVVYNMSCLFYLGKFHFDSDFSIPFLHFNL